jgi:tetrathionate reductase subunit B
VVCPTKARTFGNFDDSGSQVSALVAVNKTVRVINQETNTDPQIYYLTETAPVDWTVPASIPAPIRLFRDLGGPFIKTIVGLAGFGVLAMLGKQLLSKDADPDEDRGQEGDE